MPIPIINGLFEICERYEGFILDVWGVVHQGGEVYPEAVQCVEKLRRAKKRVIFLSNAPRRSQRIEAVLAEKGLPRALYDGVMSSGEATHLAAARNEPPYDTIGGRYVALSAAADDDLLDGLPYTATHSVGQADFLLAIGLGERRPTVEAHEDLLRSAASRNIPMVCANPDRLVIRLGQPELCAGALAARYTELGGAVHYVGKPYPAVYAPCLAQLDVADASRVVAVGDGLETDIAGANGVGLNSVLVTGGLLANELQMDRSARPDPAALESACAAAGAVPTAAITTLHW